MSNPPGVNMPGIPLQKIEGGYRIKLSDDGRHHIDVLLMLFNWRVVTTPTDCPLMYDRGWCYFGRDESSFVRAVMAAWVWDGADDSEPSGYDKAVGSR